MQTDRRRQAAYQPTILRAVIVIVLAAIGPLASGCQPTTSLPLAVAQPLAHLADSSLDYPKPGAVLVWQDLHTGETREEHVLAPDGRLFQSMSPRGRSFWYPPDPWADNENTKVSDMDALFPLQVGKRVTFTRQPKIGKTTDTVTVVRAETLQIDLGKIDTFVITTESAAVNDPWVGRSTVWYAPALHMIIQVQIDDNWKDHRARRLIAIKAP